MGFFEALSRGLERSREALNEVFYFGGEVDEDFWENLEDTLVMGDMGAEISMQVTDDLRDEAARRNLKTARQLRGALADRLSQVFVQPDGDIFRDTPSCVLFVGINGAGKTTTVGKIASDMAHRGKKVVISSMFGASAPACPWSSASAEAIPPACATTCWTRRTAWEATWSSSIPPVASIPRPSSCASSPRWSRSPASAPSR